MSEILIFVIFFILKILLVKFINLLNLKLEIAHKYSTFISIILFVIIDINYLNLDLQNSIFVILNILVFSYIFITFPGGFASSIRLLILSKFKSKKKIKISVLKKIINDQMLFNDRLKRLKNFKIIYQKKNFYYLKSSQIKLLNIFVDYNRAFFKFLKKN